MRRIRICLRFGPVLALCAAMPAFAFDYLGQFKAGDYPYDLAVEMEKHGCTMTEAAMASFLKSKGAAISDVQAHILNMAKAGQLVYSDKRQSYTLVGWGKCR